MPSQLLTTPSPCPGGRLRASESSGTRCGGGYDGGGGFGGGSILNYGLTPLDRNNSRKSINRVLRVSEPGDGFQPAFKRSLSNNNGGEEVLEENIGKEMLESVSHCDFMITNITTTMAIITPTTTISILFTKT